MINKQKPSAVYKETEVRKSSGLLSLFWMLLAIAIGAVIAVLIYRSPIFDDRRATAVQIQAEDDIVPQTNAGGASASIGAPTATSSEPINYEFYDILPKQDFRSVPEGVSVQESNANSDRVVGADAVVQAKDEPEAKMEIIEEDATYDGDDAAIASEDTKPAGTTYILQIRSYSDAAAADEKRAQVMLAGVDAVVLRRVDSATQATFYQVVSAPMSSRAEVSAAAQKLSSNGIDAVIIEQRR